MTTIQKPLIAQFTNEILDRVKKDKSGSYVQQVGYFFTYDAEGNKRLHPEKFFEYFPNRADCLAPGEYEYLLDEKSIYISRNQITLARPRWAPVKKVN